jgi:hypothetical protein
MTVHAPSQSYGALRKLGHSMECAYDMAFKDARCFCKLDSSQGKLIEVERKRGRPRQYPTNAERQAAYRKRKFEVAANV